MPGFLTLSSPPPFFGEQKQFRGSLFVQPSVPLAHSLGSVMHFPSISNKQSASDLSEFEPPPPPVLPLPSDPGAFPPPPPLLLSLPLSTSEDVPSPVVSPAAGSVPLVPAGAASVLAPSSLPDLSPSESFPGLLLLFGSVMGGSLRVSSCGVLPELLPLRPEPPQS